MVDVMTLRFEGMDTDLGAPAIPGTDVVEVGPAGAASVTDENAAASRHAGQRRVLARRARRRPADAPARLNQRGSITEGPYRRAR